jgi:Flp pilus assembly protein TadG
MGFCRINPSGNLPIRGCTGLLEMDHISSFNHPAAEPDAERTRMPKSLRPGEDGSSLIEFALCLPPLMLLMTGVFAFGIAIGNYVMLTNACSAGAMQLAISRGQLSSPNYDPCALVVSAVEAAAPTLSASNLKFVVELNTTYYPSSGTPTANLSCTSTSETAGAAGNLIQTDPVTVTVTYPCSLVVYKANNFPSCTLTAKSSEAVQ